MLSPFSGLVKAREGLLDKETPRLASKGQWASWREEAWERGPRRVDRQHGPRPRGHRERGLWERATSQGG